MKHKKIWLALLLAGAGYSGLLPASESTDFAELRAGQSDPDTWYPIRTDQHHAIRTWARREDGKSIRSFRVQAEMQGSAERVVRLLLDFPAWKRWSWRVSESRLLKKVSDTEYYAYLTHQSPVGIPDRDVVLHIRFEPASSSRPYVVVRFNAVPEYIPPVGAYVRMAAEEMTMRIQSLPGNRVRLDNEGYVDPGGSVPAWAINFVQRSVPYAIMLGMQRVIEGDSLALERPVPFATE